MKKHNKKIGIITFHNSYNCGSMLETYAMQEVTRQIFKLDVEIINFSTKGQQSLYRVWVKLKSPKDIIKNLLIVPCAKRAKKNNNYYEKFKKENFVLNGEMISDASLLRDDGYFAVIAGSDQVWNITIADASKAYFLPWVKNARKIAYAPSFGSKNIKLFVSEAEYDGYCRYLSDFSFLSVREFNGQKWLEQMTHRQVPVLVDPTLLLRKEQYAPLISNDIKGPGRKFIFFYSPDFNQDICAFVKKIADKYQLKVITWSTRSFYIRRAWRFGFKLAEYENPSSYLYYIKHAELVITTSFHGTIFSTIFHKKFITVKNGGMYGDDDRVRTLLNQIGMESRLLPYDFDAEHDYLSAVDYTEYDKKILELREKALKFLEEALDEKRK